MPGRRPQPSEESAKINSCLRWPTVPYQAVDGPMHLGDPVAAQLVEDIILAGGGRDLRPLRLVRHGEPCSRAAHTSRRAEGRDSANKGKTAFEINGLQNERGRILWQDESYDHWARDEEELFRIIAYIENNPVAAGLCQRPEDWRRSSARFRKDWGAGCVYEKNKAGWMRKCQAEA